MRPLSLAVATLSLAAAFSLLASPDRYATNMLGGRLRPRDGWTYTNCGLPTDVFDIQSIAVSPDPPQPGEDVVVTVSGVANQEIVEGAYVDVVVKLGLIKLLSKRFDLCEEARHANSSLRCPVEAGPHIIQQTVAIPRDTPRAKFGIKVNGYASDDEDLFCLALKVNFMKSLL